jgi:hypothetical protein
LIVHASLSIRRDLVKRDRAIVAFEPANDQNIPGERFWLNLGSGRKLVIDAPIVVSQKDLNSEMKTACSGDSCRFRRKPLGVDFGYKPRLNSGKCKLMTHPLTS